MSNGRVLVVFHTSEGQTAKVAGRVAAALREAGLDVDLAGANDAPHPGGFRAVVVGDPVRYARQSKPVRRWVAQHSGTLDAMPSAFFQVSLAAQSPDASTATELARLSATVTTDVGWHPDVTARFAGALAYSQYNWLIKRMLRRLVARHDGDTDMGRDYEYTDWDAVDRFAVEVAALVEQSPA